MKQIINRIAGALLITAAIAGFLFSIAGVVGVWRYKDDFTDRAMANLDVIVVTLDTTSTGLEVADLSLQTSLDSVLALQDTMTATGNTISATRPMLDTMIILTKEDLPETLGTIQTSLAAAEESAAIIDGVLRAFNSIPFLPGNLYNPPVPLNEALGDVSASLEGLPQALDTIETSLIASRDNIVVIQADVRLMARDLDSIYSSMLDAQDVIRDYQDTVQDLQERMERIQNRLPGWFDNAAIILTFFLVWMGVSQIGFFIQGLWLMRGIPPA